MPAYSWVPDVITPTITTSATPDYSAGDSIGGKIELTSVYAFAGDAKVIESVQILDKANVKATFEILIFDSDPSAGTYTDNQAVALSTDNVKIKARIPVTTVDYITVDSMAIANLPGLGRVVKSGGTTSLWMVLVATATVNLATTSDIQVAVGFV